MLVEDLPEEPLTDSPLAERLVRLLADEQDSLLRFIGPGSPILRRADATAVAALLRIEQASGPRMQALADAIVGLGGTPPPRQVNAEEQYLAFLSFDYLLPKLLDAKRSLIAAYEEALRQLPDTLGRERDLIESGLDQHRQDLAMLEAA